MVQGKEKTENGCVLNIWCIETIFTGVARGSAFVHSGGFFYNNHFTFRKWLVQNVNSCLF